MKIGIVGPAPGRRPDFSICDEYYGLAWDGLLRDFFDFLFEPHETIEHRKPNLIFDVNQSNKPVYVNQLGVFNKEILLTPESDYLESSAAYMLDTAISNHPEEIHIWGIKMDADDEYQYQRANFEYLIGFARGRGIKVFIYDSSLCRYSKYFPVYPERYGKC